MRKGFLSIMLLYTAFCFLLAGCSAAGPGDGSSQAESEHTTTDQNKTETTQ